MCFPDPACVSAFRFFRTSRLSIQLVIVDESDLWGRFVRFVVSAGQMDREQVACTEIAAEQMTKIKKNYCLPIYRLFT